MDNILAIMNPFSIDKNPTDILKELAQRANVSLGSYKRFESSGHISLDSLLKIAFILGKLDDFETVFQSSKNKNLEKLFK